MEERTARLQVVEVGRQLLEEGLVARTWGNVSSRLDETHFLITPSGLSYVETEPEDLAVYDIATDEWTGPRKPSGERGVHKAAYEVFPNAGFVIHTHQTYASALGVCGAEQMDITPEERERLGGFAAASYGMPGTAKLKNAVKSAFESGAQTVLMAHHGAVVCAGSREEAYERVCLLEEICRRNYGDRKAAGEAEREKMEAAEKRLRELADGLKGKYPHIAVTASEAVMRQATDGKPIVARLDDMSQMIGRWIEVFEEKELEKALQKYNAVMVKNLGAVVRGDDEDDAAALRLLTEKAAVCARHAQALGSRAKISAVDSAIMRRIYVTKYSKQKSKN